MQFIANGPDIPNTLLEAHEEGRVIFFCGAGISYPAGLPGFRQLVDEIYRIVGTTLETIEEKAYSSGRYDATLGLLEHRLPGQRFEVRKALLQALQPKLRRKGATETHSALIQLARGRDDALRLVTTNFDRIFVHVLKRTKSSAAIYAAPLLPITKMSRWNGLVHLHGLLPEDQDITELNRLVITSGDFGLAYLTERWAARFVSEIFRNYIVCFVGYSIDDPVLRYMMDALAADRLLGESTPQAYAFGDFERAEQENKIVEWKTKGVTPILYEVPSGKDDHSALHRTLKLWADTYRDGILGKERIVVDYGLARPSASTVQDNFVGRMLWAITHSSGLPAKRFAELNPVPSLDWLETFSKNEYRHDNLARFRVPPLPNHDKKLTFSVISRPAPYNKAPWMELVGGGPRDSQWDWMMLQLARWLVRHLNDHALILWIAQRGGHLSDGFADLIEREFERFAQLELENNMIDLDGIRAQAPNAIPSPSMRKLWRLLLSGIVKSAGHDRDLYSWQDRFKRDGLTVASRIELRELLAPKVALSKSLRWWGDGEIDTESPQRLKDIVDWELVLTTENVQSVINDIAETKNWRTALPLLVGDFQQLLRDALDLHRELSDTDEPDDHSYWDLPSISSHSQNRGFRTWVVLIELVRDAWLAVREIDSARASSMAESWFDQPYLTFKRLALFSASYDQCIAPEKWVEWLHDDHARWLWSAETQREVLRLLVLQGLFLTFQVRSQLETAILSGPPRAMYRVDLELDAWQKLVDHSIWLRLAKLQSSGCALGDIAKIRLSTLSTSNPKWRFRTNERDEFPHWMGGTGDPDFEEYIERERAPKTRRELVDWLQRPPPSPPFREDNWRETLRTRFFHCAYALCDLARANKWPVERWREALQVCGEERLLLRSWKFLAPVVVRTPDKEFFELSSGIAWWLKEISKSIDRHESIFLSLSRRILEQQHDDEVHNTDEPVTQAINHTVGHVTQALLTLWFKREPNDNDGLPNNLEPIFTQLCGSPEQWFRHGRVLLASRLIALFRVDPNWTEKNLLPLFDWHRHQAEAGAVWEGFLWSPRLYRPLLIAFKSLFLDTARHYFQLGRHSRQFAIFLTYAALEPVETYTPHDFQAALSDLPQKGLQESAQALVEALEGAGDKREEYWTNRIAPFWHNVWPKSRQFKSGKISESLARMVIKAGNKFPEALAVISHWLQPLEYPYIVVRLLLESELSKRFPKDALHLLNAVIDEQSRETNELGKCMQIIYLASPELVHDSRYRRLVECSRQYGA